MAVQSSRPLDGRTVLVRQIVPAVGRHADPFFQPPETRPRPKSLLRRLSDLFRRFDILDWLLWIIPPLLTLLLYRICETQLDRLIQPLLQGSLLP